VFGGCFGGFEKLRKRSLVEIFSLQPDGLDLCCVVDVGERIGAQFIEPVLLCVIKYLT
jgi:hypothetical protein